MNKVTLKNKVAAAIAIVGVTIAATYDAVVGALVVIIGALYAD